MRGGAHCNHEGGRIGLQGRQQPLCSGGERRRKTKTQTYSGAESGLTLEARAAHAACILKSRRDSIQPPRLSV